MDFRTLINAVSLLEAKEVKATRRVQDTGGLTNFNIDRDDPSKLFTGLRNGSDDYGADDIVQVYYKNDERLESFLANSDGRGAVEVDADGNPVEASQTDAELDADSADNGAGDSAAAQAASQTGAELDADAEDSGAGIRLSDGTNFDPNNEQDRNAAASKLDELIRRYNELTSRMNESAPVSIRGYLKEYNLFEEFLTEALSDSEKEELRNIITDINVLADGGILSEPNTAAARQAIADAPSGDALRPTAASTSSAASADDANAADSSAAEAPPEAERASDASGDQNARVEPGDGNTSNSLEAFANSGKGGLANDADETDAITELQQFLTDLGFDPNGVDGKYGRGTIAAVRTFQGAFGATQDGDAGPETIGKIVEYRNDMAEIDELIDTAKSETSVAESTDFRSLINLVENMLKEAALTDQQKARAQELIDKYEPLVANLPDPAKGQLSQRIEDLQGYMATSGNDAEAEAETNPANMDDAQKATAIHDGIDGMGTDEEAVLAVLGSIADEAELDRVKSAFQQLFNEDMMDWINSEVTFGDQNAVDNIISRITGDSDGPQTVEDIVGASEAAKALDEALNGGFFFGLGTEEQAVLEILGRISTRDFPTVMQEFERISGNNLLTDLESELSGTDKQRVNDIIKRFGYEFQDEDPGYKEIGAEAGETPPDTTDDARAARTNAAASGEAASGEAVYIQTTGSGRNLRWTSFDAEGNEVDSGISRNKPNLPTRTEWEATQGGAEGGAEGGADAAQASEPTNDLQQRIARIEGMGTDTPEKARAYMQALKDDEEIFNLLPQGDKDAINIYLNG